MQYSTTHRTNSMTQLNTDIGSSAQIIVYSGAIPANVAASVTGTLLVQFAGNAGSFGTASAGVLTANAVANANASNGGVCGYFRINTSGGTPVVQGTVYQAQTLVTSASTAANGNVLTFSAVTGISVGMTASGTGIPTGAMVVATSSTTVTLSTASTAGVGSGTTISFGGDMTIVNATLVATQTCNLTSLAINAFGA